jgi:hypothetical protein
MSLTVFHFYAVRIVYDSPRYLEYAHQLQLGFYVDPHNIWYIGYVGFIFLIQRISTDPAFLILVQYLFSFLGVLALYETYVTLFQRRKPALITSLSFIFFIELITWNSYVLCEAFYVSMICFSLYFLSRYYQTPRPATLVPLFIILPLTIIIKPTGWAILLALAAVGWYQLSLRWKQVAWRIALTLGVVIAALGSLEVLFSSFRIVENYQTGELVYGISTLPSKPQYDPLIIGSNALVEPEQHRFKLFTIAHFILLNPWYWSKLFFLKICYFLAHIRPYWSWYHNLYSILYLLPCYYLAMRAIGKRMEKPIVIFCSVFLTLHTLAIGLTSVDWDGRFLMPLLPVIFLLASRGLYITLYRLDGIK